MIRFTPTTVVTTLSINDASIKASDNLVTNDASTWEDMLASAGTTGRPIIEKKFEIVFDYMLNSWGLDLDKLREIVLRRQSEITELDLSTL